MIFKIVPRATQSFWFCIYGFVLTAMCGNSFSAEELVSRIFSDHMVLQRDVSVPVWGWVNFGQVVTVSIDKQRKVAVGDANGKWIVRLDAMAVGLPRKMTILSGAKKNEIDDILVGEVWLASGQSNMVFPLNQAEGGKQEIASAVGREIRFFNVSRAVAPKQLRDNLPFGDDTPAGLNVWKTAVAPDVGDFSAVAYFFAVNLHQDIGVPVGIISNAVSNSAIEAWISREGYAGSSDFKVISQYYEGLANYVENTPQGKHEYAERSMEYANQQASLKAAGKPPLWPSKYIGPVRSDGFASTFYNAMMHPLIPYAMRGVLWYQGEAQGDRMDDYRGLLPLLIDDWRTHLEQESLPFIFVQLPNWGPRNSMPSSGGWAVLREAQLLALKVPHTAMAVTIDIGEAANIHPRNKRDVGTRLSLAALGTVYGKKITYSGPIYSFMKPEKGGIRLAFNHVGSGLMVGFKDASGKVVAEEGAKLQQFAIASADMKFVWANAVIEGDSVVVWSPQIPVPVAVRYAWASNPEGANLYNRAGLPASPFRTDPVIAVESAAAFKRRIVNGFTLKQKQ